MLPSNLILESRHSSQRDLHVNPQAPPSGFYISILNPIDPLASVSNLHVCICSIMMCSLYSVILSVPVDLVMVVNLYVSMWYVDTT
jgi:hypothetical protein